MNLSGKTVLVTGAARRIGRAVALALAEQGVDVIVHYRTSVDQAGEVVDQIAARGVRSTAIKADLGLEAEARGVIEKALTLTGRLDILVNSASIFQKARLESVEQEDFRRNLAVNSLGPFTLMQEFYRIVKRQGSPGSIINFLDTRIADNDRDHVAYAVSKRALHTLTQMAAAEFAPTLRVNAVAPGLVLPPTGEDESYLERLRDTNPLRSFGTLEEVTDAVLFLAGNAFVTGQTIWVDGGRHLRGSFYGS